VRTTSGRWAIARSSPFRNAAGRIEGAVITFVDVTDLKKLQEDLQNQSERLEGILESDGSGYWDWNVQQDSVHLSPRLQSMLGYSDADVEKPFNHWVSLVHPEDTKAFKRKISNFLESNGDGVFSYEGRFLHRKGATIWVLCRGHVVDRAEDGSPLRIMGIQFDVTEIKQRESEVRRRAEEVRRFAYIAAHDLMQPMNTIKFSLDNLRTELSDRMTDDISDVLGYLTHGTERMQVRIAGVREYADLDDTSTDLEPMDMHALFASCLEDMQTKIDEAGSSVTLDDMPNAFGIPGLMSRVVLNLLRNALQYRRQDRAHVIHIDSIPRADRFITYRISDNGIGIDPKHRERVFDLFYRLHVAEEYPGDGIGMAICDRVISQAGGSIWVEDGIDGGVSVLFSLRTA